MKVLGVTCCDVGVRFVGLWFNNIGPGALYLYHSGLAAQLFWKVKRIQH